MGEYYFTDRNTGRIIPEEEIDNWEREYILHICTSSSKYYTDIYTWTRERDGIIEFINFNWTQEEVDMFGYSNLLKQHLEWCGLENNIDKMKLMKRFYPYKEYYERLNMLKNVFK